MRRATPPWVRKLPARMKNGIAMISNFSMPVKSFSATESIGTSVSVNRKVSTVRPSAIEIGMPVSISATSSTKIMPTRAPATDRQIAELARQNRPAPAAMSESPMTISSGRRRCATCPAWGRVRVRGGAHLRSSWSSDAGQRGRCVVETFDVAVIVMRKFAGAGESPCDLQEAEAHQIGAERHREIDDPHRQSRDRPKPARYAPMCQTKRAPSEPTISVNSAPRHQAEQDDERREFGFNLLIATSTPTWMPVRTP